MKAFSLVLSVWEPRAPPAVQEARGGEVGSCPEPRHKSSLPQLVSLVHGGSSQSSALCFSPTGRWINIRFKCPWQSYAGTDMETSSGQVLCAQEGRRGALGDGGTLIHLCSSAPVPTPVEAKGKAHPGHSMSNILASPWWASGLWLWFQLSQPARAPLFWPSAPPGLVQALLLIYIFIVCLPGFSPEIYFPLLLRYDCSSLLFQEG